MRYKTEVDGGDPRRAHGQGVRDATMALLECSSDVPNQRPGLWAGQLDRRPVLPEGGFASAKR